MFCLHPCHVSPEPWQADTVRRSPSFWLYSFSLAVNSHSHDPQPQREFPSPCTAPGPSHIASSHPPNSRAQLLAGSVFPLRAGECLLSSDCPWQTVQCDIWGPFPFAEGDAGSAVVSTHPRLLWHIPMDRGTFLCLPSWSVSGGPADGYP